MPTILRTGSYRFFFYAGDVLEPAYVHVSSEDNLAKFWLEPVRLQSSGGFNRVEINKIYKIVIENREIFLEAWHEYFGK